MNRRRTLALLAVAGPLLAACGGPLGSGTDPDDDRPHVVASFYPLAFVAEQVAGDHARVTHLTAPGVEPHDLELTVEQTAQISAANVAFYQSGFQPAVDEAVDQSGVEHRVDAAEIAQPPAEDPDHGDDGHAEDEHADDDGHAEDEHADDDGHAHEGGDPHFWLDPVQLSAVADAFADELAAADPDNAGAYEANLADLQDELAALDEELTEGLARCEIDTVVVSHDAFGYLGRYGLDFEAIAGLSPDVEPSPAHIAELHELIRDEGVTTVFHEPLASTAMSQSIARDLGLRTDVLDPIEGLGDETADEDYFSLMRQNLTAIQEANRCR